MRVLAVGNMYPPHHLGGYELLWQSTMRATRAAGHEVRVLTTDHLRPDAGAEQDPGVHRTLRWWWSDHAFPRLAWRERVALVRQDHSELDRQLSEFAPDVVSWWAMGGMPLSLIESVRRAGIPAVSVVIDDWLVYGPEVDQWTRVFGGPRRVAAPLGEWIVSVPAAVSAGALGRTLFCSRYVRERAARTGFALADTDLVSPGIDERFLEPVPPREWSWKLGYVGRIDERKGIATAIEALTQLPSQATLTIVGEGDPAAETALREQSAALGLADRVTFAGAVDARLLPDAYAAADTIVFPVIWDEPWGLVPLEAMGVGRPVIATGSGGSGEYLRDGENTLLFEAGDAGALATAVRRLAGDPALRSELIRGGLRTAAQHTAAAFDARIVAEFEQAASRSRGA